MDFLTRGVEQVEKAIEADQKQDYAEAYRLYRDSLDYFMLAIKHEKNPSTRTRIQNKATEYLTRAETLKKHLESTRTVPQVQNNPEALMNSSPTDLRNRGIDIITKAIEEDEKQDYTKALQLYKDALDYFIAAAKFEDNIQRKMSIKTKIKEYLERAEVIQDFLRDQAAKQTNTLLSTEDGPDPLSRAINTVKLAIEQDEKHNYFEAYKGYQNALDYFMLALKWEKNDQSKELIRKKVAEYLTRAEKLKEYLIGGEVGPNGSHN